MFGHTCKSEVIIDQHHGYGISILDIPTKIMYFYVCMYVYAILKTLGLKSKAKL